MVRQFIDLVHQNSGKLLQQALVHSGLTFLSVFIAIVISVPLGILITRKTKWRRTVLGSAGILQTIPSIALLGFLIPVMGIGVKPAIVALFLYAILPIINNTFIGIRNVDSIVKEAAGAMGMTSRQILFKVELPLAFPVIMTGIRTATVINVGVATLAAYIGAGGLGEFIFSGIALNNSAMILAGAIPSALLALLFDFLLSRVEHANIRKAGKMLGISFFGFFLLTSLFFIPKTFQSKLIAGFQPEFMERSDGWPGLQRVYHLKITTRMINQAMLYKAIAQQDVDVISGYSTDGRVKANHLFLLKDDKHVFPPYFAAPLVREEILIKYPELRPTMNLLAGKISDSLMTEMNYKVDELNEDPQQVASAFLKKINLYKKPEGPRTGTVIIGSKIFSEQYILIDLYKMLIEGHTSLQVITKTGLGGTQISFDALKNGQIDLYPEYTGTALQVILQTPQNEIDDLVSIPGAVDQFLQEQFHEKYHLTWLKPIGFNNTYALMMRHKQAKKLGITTISGLTSYLDKR